MISEGISGIVTVITCVDFMFKLWYFEDSIFINKGLRSVYLGLIVARVVIIFMITNIYSY